MRNNLAILVAGALCAPALAAEPAVVIRDDHLFLADASTTGDAWRRWAEDFSQGMRASMGSMFGHRVGSSKVTKGAPYSADVINESNQTLADGNVISRKSTGRVYRDGEGRTRQESEAPGREASVHISDPVAKSTYVLNSTSRTATELPGHVWSWSHGGSTPAVSIKDKRVFRFGGEEIRIEDGKVFHNDRESPDGVVVIQQGGKEIRVEKGKVTVNGKEITAEGGKRVVVKRGEASTPVDGSVQEKIHVEIIRSGDGKEISVAVPPIPPIPPVPGAAAAFGSHPGAFPMRHESMAKHGKGVTTSLGMKEFDGVKAEGKSTVWTIAAGEVGNRNPIQVTSESWFSPDLQVTVYSRHSDPRHGETIYRLSGIKRAEPAADLFKVPEGYKVKARARAEARS